MMTIPFSDLSIWEHNNLRDFQARLMSIFIQTFQQFTMIMASQPIEETSVLIMSQPPSGLRTT